MAKELRMPYFMSDDSGLKYYVNKWFSSNKHSIEIVSIYEVLLWCTEWGYRHYMERLEFDNYSDFLRKKEKIGGNKESVCSVDEKNCSRKAAIFYAV